MRRDNGRYNRTPGRHTVREISESLTGKCIGTCKRSRGRNRLLIRLGHIKLAAVEGDLHRHAIGIEVKLKGKRGALNQRRSYVGDTDAAGGINDVVPSRNGHAAEIRKIVQRDRSRHRTVGIQHQASANMQTATGIRSYAGKDIGGTTDTGSRKVPRVGPLTHPHTAKIPAQPTHLRSTNLNLVRADNISGQYESQKVWGIRSTCNGGPAK